MWVFGYGSLMWGGWEAGHGCIRRARAGLHGYRRVFNKASVSNWGSKKCPCPTLNLTKSNSAHCQGIAFEFPDERKPGILKYLTKREGAGFLLCALPAQLESGDVITPLVPLYEGKNLIRPISAKRIAEMALRATGKDGSCIDYINSIAAELRRLEIDDPAVSQLWWSVSQLR
jgi:glutathione-specific gamma-glutamylcyclotransferase